MCVCVCSCAKEYTRSTDEQGDSEAVAKDGVLQSLRDSGATRASLAQGTAVAFSPGVRV